MKNSSPRSKFAENPLIAHPPPAGFSARHDGIYVDVEDKDGEITSEWLCSPLAVVARGRNGQQVGWSKRIELSDPDGVLHKVFIAEKDLTSGFNKVLGRLCDHGLNLSVGPAARKHLNGLISRWEPVERYMTTDRLGWSDTSCRAFVLGDKRVIGRQDTIYLNDTAPAGSPAMTRHGTLDEWREDVSRRCRGNPVLMTAVSLAFAAPLLEVLGRETIGMHLRGRSSTGKTTAVKIAVSVWGRPELMQRWRATTNALEDHAAKSNGSLLALDELGQVSAHEVGGAVYMLGNGQGKGRSTSNGQPRSTAKWRLTYLSNGEISLADKMAEAGKSIMAGQEVRFIDISADIRRHGVFDDLHGALNGDVFAKAIEQAAAERYGSAGPAFVEKLIASKEARHRLPKMIERLTTRWKADLDTNNDGMADRVLGHFALIAVSGELATIYGITGWEKGEAQSALFELAEQWCRDQDRPERRLVEAAAERTREYLIKHGDKCFKRKDAGVPPELHGYRDDKWFYVLGDAWNAIHAGHSGADEAKHLEASGWLVRGDGRNMKSKTPFWVPDRQRAYKIKAAILESTVTEVASAA